MSKMTVTASNGTQVEIDFTEDELRRIARAGDFKNWPKDLQKRFLVAVNGMENLH